MTRRHITITGALASSNDYSNQAKPDKERTGELELVQMNDGTYELCATLTSWSETDRRDFPYTIGSVPGEIGEALFNWIHDPSRVLAELSDAGDDI